jgi:pimeloyl-ACP methyl ester carboxylesterase
MRRILIVVLPLAVIALAAASFPLGWWNRSDAALLALFTRENSRFLEFDGTRIHYLDEGEGPPILLIHGSNESVFAWDGVARELARNHRVIRFDVPDYGLSAPDAKGDYSIERDLARIEALRQHLGVDRLAVAGCSFGGVLAFSYAAAQPQRVTALVLVSSAGARQPDARFVPRPNALERWVGQYYRPRYVVERELSAVAGHAVDPAVVDEVHALVNRRGRIAEQRRRGAGVQRGAVAGNADNPRLGEVVAPTLVIWGEANRALPPSTAEVFRSLLKQARTEVVVLPGVGHKPEREAPREVAGHVQSFLAGAAAAATTDSSRIEAARRVVEAFRGGMGGGVAERTLALYHPDVVMYRTGGRPPVVGREAMRPIEEFHAVVRPQVTFHGLEFEARGARVAVSTRGATERAPLFAAMGLPQVTMRAMRDALEIEDGRIVVMREAGFKPSCERVMPQAIRSTLQWLRVTADPRLDVIAPGGRPRIDGTTAAPWIAAIGDWRRATGWTPPADAAADCGRFDP